MQVGKAHYHNCNSILRNKFVYSNKPKGLYTLRLNTGFIILIISGFYDSARFFLESSGKPALFNTSIFLKQNPSQFTVDRGGSKIPP
jgi:hypothetical protein